MKIGGYQTGRHRETYNINVNVCVRTEEQDSRNDVFPSPERRLINRTTRYTDRQTHLMKGNEMSVDLPVFGEYECEMFFISFPSRIYTSL